MRRTAKALSVILVVLGVGLGACGDRRQESEAPPSAGPAAPAEAEAPETSAAAPAAEAPPAAEPAPEPEAAEPAAPAQAEAQPAAAEQPATIEFEIYKAGFIVGVSGGKGTLHFRGRSYPLSIGGVSVGATAGISKAELMGEVRNLRQVQDIEGTYSAVQAGLTVGGGAKVTRLTNTKKVELDVRGKQMGIELSLDLNGMQISLAK